ncbi:hypothetical protein CC80DRAFT_39391 [Byssothecium circinans]|uniref:Uncharacterized protein n=1 Tax=Byssothecium circinans TaxID=147558 RepID=A0A6A5U040_9PLEO|nr:hypothetical protein CC80DRAFT_39391 [Byssothecium circinans]
MSFYFSIITTSLSFMAISYGAQVVLVSLLYIFHIWSKSSSSLLLLLFMAWLKRAVSEIQLSSLSRPQVQLPAPFLHRLWCHEPYTRGSPSWGKPGVSARPDQGGVLKVVQDPAL